MSPQLPVISGRKAVRAFEKAGFRFLRQAGSHIIIRRDQPFAQLSVPDHKVLDRGTLRSLVRQSGLSVQEFIELL